MHSLGLAPLQPEPVRRRDRTHGEQKAEAWLKGVVANLARPPKGGDTDQIKAVAAGECDIAVSSSYYLARLMRSA